MLEWILAVTKWLHGWKLHPRTRMHVSTSFRKVCWEKRTESVWKIIYGKAINFFGMWLIVDFGLEYSKFPTLEIAE